MLQHTSFNAVLTKLASGTHQEPHDAMIVFYNGQGIGQWLPHYGTQGRTPVSCHSVWVFCIFVLIAVNKTPMDLLPIVLGKK